LHECRVALWNVAITPSGHKSNEALGFSLEKRLRRSKGNCLRGEKKKKMRVSSRPRRQISRGTSSTASLYDALLCMLPLHRYDRYDIREFSVQMTITQPDGIVISRYTCRKKYRRAWYTIQQIKKYLYAPLPSILNLFPFLI